MITGSFDQHAKRISVENREVDKDFGRVCSFPITRIKITADDGKLLLGDTGGNFRMLSSRSGLLLKDFGVIHSSITGIMITSDKKFFFTSSADGELRQWNYIDNTLVRDHGKIAGDILSLCL